MIGRASLLIVSAIIVAGMLGGCATTKGPSPEELVMQTIAGWTAAAEAKDVDKMMAFIAEDFSSSEWPDKETYRDFVKESIDMGYLDDLKISTENAKITFEAKNKAVVYPIDATASFGSASLKTVLTDENGKWLVTDVTMEQY